MTILGCQNFVTLNRLTKNLTYNVGELTSYAEFHKFGGRQLAGNMVKCTALVLFLLYGRFLGSLYRKHNYNISSA